MKGRTILIITLFFMTLVAIACVQSELSWLSKENSPQNLRQLIGLPSIAVGNLSPAARNPGLEIFCASFYDVPGGFCQYFTQGVPYENLPWSNAK